jgi:calcineurin-like phosphoesterase family protein
MTIHKLYKYGYIELNGDDLEEKVFFTSDHHFDHTNIIKLCNRPFSSINEMNEVLIDNWNKTVPENGLIFILGDVVWSKDPRRWITLMEKLNGQKILIKGNHDDFKVLEKIEHLFLTIRERLELRLDSARLMLDHYPMKEWSGSYRGVYSLYGHIHEKDFPDAKYQQYNVSVERNKYRPISWNEVSMIFTKQVRDETSNLTLRNL